MRAPNNSSIGWPVNFCTQISRSVCIGILKSMNKRERRIRLIALHGNIGFCCCEIFISQCLPDAWNTWSSYYSVQLDVTLRFFLGLFRRSPLFAMSHVQILAFSERIERREIIIIMVINMCIFCTRPLLNDAIFLVMLNVHHELDENIAHHIFEIQHTATAACKLNLEWLS